jgi:hypothetical protein
LDCTSEGNRAVQESRDNVTECWFVLSVRMLDSVCLQACSASMHAEGKKPRERGVGIGQHLDSSALFVL